MAMMGMPLAMMSRPSAILCTQLAMVSSWRQISGLGPASTQAGPSECAHSEAATICRPAAIASDPWSSPTDGIVFLLRPRSAPPVVADAASCGGGAASCG